MTRTATNNPPIATIYNEDLGRLTVYQDPIYGDEEPLVVIDANGIEVPNDYYDLEDIKTLDGFSFKTNAHYLK